MLYDRQLIYIFSNVQPAQLINCKSSTLHSTFNVESPSICCWASPPPMEGWHSTRIRVGKLNWPSGTRAWAHLQCKGVLILNSLLIHSVELDF